MQGWFDKIKSSFGKKQAEQPALVTTVNTVYEINLVPDVKLQMIKSQKLRNLVLFICILISSLAIGAVLVLFMIKSGQDIAMSSQDKKLETLSAKLLGYDELDDLVAIQGQLNALSDISANKNVLSRVFAALGVMLPTGGDSVQLSELRVNLEDSSITMDGQADARVAPLIDYRVLESFKKGIELTRYDYGRYVDVNGKEIPTRCINETDGFGNALKQGESYYAWWDLTTEGCNAVVKGSNKDNSTGLEYSKDADVEKAVQEVMTGNTVSRDDGENAGTESEDDAASNGVPQTEEVVTRVKVWRTPQYDKWYLGGMMTPEGEIAGVEHFDSACINYKGASVSESKKSTIKWTSTNDCALAPDGLTVTSSTNARDESNNLVLKFTATANIDPEFFSFRNKHMIAIGPLGQNVTDSYVQIQGMFAQEAQECDANDADCLNNVTNTGGNK